MTDRDHSHEMGGVRPEDANNDPSTLALLRSIADILESGEGSVLKHIELAERDLRNISTNPRFSHALERAEHLERVRLPLEKLLEQVRALLPEEASLTRTTKALGEASVREIPRPKPSL